MCGSFLYKEFIKMNNKHELFMKEAIKEAKKALKKQEVPIGCVIVKNNQIISRAYNKRETKQSSVAHAEILAIQKASKKLKSWHLDDCILYVSLEPCMMCLGAIYQSRIKKVIYGARSFQDGAIESAMQFKQVKGLNHYPETIYFDKLEDCSKIISDYFKTKR